MEDKLLTLQQVLDHKLGVFFNTVTHEIIRKSATIKALKKHPDIKETLLKDDTPRFLVQTNTKRWDKETGKMRTHESSCEFGKKHCECWCKDLYHGIRGVI